MVTEPMRRQTPLGAVAEELARTCAGDLFRCHEDGFRRLAELRSAPGGEGSVGELVGGDLPATGELRLGDTLVLGLGPRWWLLDAPAEVALPPSTVDVSCVDVSAQRTPLVLSGPRASDVLAHGCSLDLHPAHFAVGHCASTLLAKAGVVVARTADQEYRVWVRASFARYLAAWVMDASVEYR